MEKAVTYIHSAELMRVNAEASTTQIMRRVTPRVMSLQYELPFVFIYSSVECLCKINKAIIQSINQSVNPLIKKNR